jgi:hypothetical protein
VATNTQSFEHQALYISARNCTDVPTFIMSLRMGSDTSSIPPRLALLEKGVPQHT